MIVMYSYDSYNLKFLLKTHITCIMCKISEQLSVFFIIIIIAKSAFYNGFL